MYFQPTDAQRQRIADLLATASLNRDQLLVIAMAVGLPDLVHTFKTRNSTPTPDPGPEPAAPRRQWWRIWNRPTNT
jgi:hypothetical protein